MSDAVKAGVDAAKDGAKALKSPAGKSLLKGAGRVAGKVMMVGSVVDTAKDLKKGKLATAATDAAYLLPGVGIVAGLGLAGLQATGVTDKLDKKISKVLKPGSEVSSKYAGSHKLEKTGKEMAAKGENKFNIAHKLMDGYKNLGKGGIGTAVAIGAAMFAVLGGLTGIDKQKSSYKEQEGPSLG